ncbi:class I SAM-dependent methyltransferase [Leeia oryzae]|uniref:class I SAM-dependent methyltransferase n=1 Tax=Leeia oryzae TaxID=356662 RepID=UPI00036858AD|nr:class I SAM-dependent methyltransferase [Leeia oryzae]
MDTQQHWEQVYTTKAADTVSWYQPQASESLQRIQQAQLASTARIIDVGGGASTLVDGLLAAGFTRLTVLDISDAALTVARQRLGPAAAQVTWLAGDVTRVALPVAGFDVWHDRAVFHFLTDAADRAAYVRQMTPAVVAGGLVIMATFAEDGPEKCSGLPVVRYTPAGLAAELGDGFVLTASQKVAHHTPLGNVQSFVYCSFIKR